MALQTNQDALEAAADRMKARQAGRRESLTFYGMSQIGARILLIAAGLLWLRAYLVYIDPFSNIARDIQDGVINPSHVVNTLLDFLLAVVFAAGQAIIPPLSISVLVTNSPAQIVLNKLNLKIGIFWYIFAIGTGIFLSWQSFNLVYQFWYSRPVFSGPDGLDPYPFAITTMLLLVGFPAWAINQLTPSQWVDAMLLSRAALAIKHAVDIEDTAAKALVVRVRGLLLADVMELTLEQRAANNQEVAGILAGCAKSFKYGLLQVAESQRALTGYQAQLGLDDDKALVAKMTAVARVLTDTQNQLGFTTDYAGMIARGEPATSAGSPIGLVGRDLQTAAPIPAEVISVATEPARSAIGRTEEMSRDYPFAEALGAMLERFGAEPWMRRHVEEVLKVEKTKAGEMVTAWKNKGLIRELTDPKFHYVATVKLKT